MIDYYRKGNKQKPIDRNRLAYDLFRLPEGWMEWTDSGKQALVQIG